MPCVGRGGLPEFLEAAPVKALDRPDGVVEQWLYDHSDFDRFLIDYERLDLSTLRSHNTAVEQFLTMPTGASEASVTERFAQNPGHWSDAGHHQGVPEHWQAHGTWLRRPLLLDRTLFQPLTEGLQVIEGRTRVGVLRGFLERGRPVAATHAAWVARPVRTQPPRGGPVGSPADVGVS